MSKSFLTDAIARKTGEDYDVIAHRGFSLVNEECPLDDQDLMALVADWDRIQAEYEFSLAIREIEPTFDDCRTIGASVFVNRHSRTRKPRVTTVQGH